MFYDGIKLTVGVQKTTQEKVQYCLTAVGVSQKEKPPQAVAKLWGSKPIER